MREKRKPVGSLFLLLRLLLQHSKARLARHFSLIESGLELGVSVPFSPETMDGDTRSVILSFRLHVNDLRHSIS